MLVSLAFFAILTFLLQLPPALRARMTLHVVPHSHCDPGFTKTTEQYFATEVKPILDGMVAYVDTHPEMKYNWVESIYMKMWWDQASEDQKATLQKLVRSGRWEMVMGGWVMNDEACETYSASIDQLTLGHQFVKHTFGVSPREGWAIDPFGSTSTQAYLYTLLGFEYHALRRIPEELRDLFRVDRSLEFHWEGSRWNKLVAGKKPLLTRIMWADSYRPPGFLEFWEPGCKPLTPKDLPELADAFVVAMEAKALSYRSKNHLFLPFGGDFAFQNPPPAFGNMSMFMEYINHHKVLSDLFELKYSTIGEYFDAITSEGLDFPKKTDVDFWVYDSAVHAQWSGYYTSQPRIKLAARRGERILRESEQLFVMGFALGTTGWTKQELMLMFDSSVMLLREKSGQLQHHDALTGTSKFFVDVKYLAELEEGIVASQKLSASILSSLISKSMFIGNQTTTQKAFVSADGSIEGTVVSGDSIGFVVWNSLSWTRTENIRLEFSSPSIRHLAVSVTDASGKTLYPSSVSRDEQELKEIVAEVSVPPVGFRCFVMHVRDASDAFSLRGRSKKEASKRGADDDDNSAVSFPRVLENAVYRVEFDDTNRVSKITNKIDGVSQPAHFSLRYYTSYHTNQGKEQQSGAYIMRTQPPHTLNYVTREPLTVVRYVNDSLTNEVQLQWTDWAVLTFRLNQNGADNNFLEMSADTLGTIPENHELILRFDTGIKNKKVVYHDDLALEMKKKDFKVFPFEEPVATNQYPMQYGAFIEDEASRFTAMTSKSQTVSSQDNGAIEFLVHRRCQNDDGKGVGQALNDTYVMTNGDFRMRFMLSTNKKSTTAADLARHSLSYRLNFPLAVSPFLPSHWNLLSYPPDFKDSLSFLSSPLPDSVHLLSLFKVDSPSLSPDESTFVCRVCNLLQEGQAVEEVDLRTMWNGELGVVLKEANEMSLTLLRELGAVNNTKIELRPLEIRTFGVEF